MGRTEKQDAWLNLQASPSENSVLSVSVKCKRKEGRVISLFFPSSNVRVSISTAPLKLSCNMDWNIFSCNSFILWKSKFSFQRNYGYPNKGVFDEGCERKS